MDKKTIERVIEFIIHMIIAIIIGIIIVSLISMIPEPEDCDSNEMQMATYIHVSFETQAPSVTPSPEVTPITVVAVINPN